ncbi:hypothetical protein PFFCH_03905 [Plasmodium falciparum FCH/4]|nr:hypothetical protein PFFCH_03905 [Plasmodium falciparum FCH/4]ETW46823.1 hypothetical protein PFMALIP_05104 [Plasmodium falciparum MaliPS096_E11]EWC85644.1 hypothetical protein PFNF54_05311 [Plasmodium falciparum NF54]
MKGKHIIEMLYHQMDEKKKNEMNKKKRKGYILNLRLIENHITIALKTFKFLVKEYKIENIFFPISVEIKKKIIEKSKYINGTPLNEFIYSEFLSGIDLKLRVFKLKCIMLKIMKILITFLKFDILIILKCSRIFLKEDNLIINVGIPLGLLPNRTVLFLLNNIEQTIATKSYSKTIFHYIPPEIKNKLKIVDCEQYIMDYTNNKQTVQENMDPLDYDTEKNCFYFDDKLKLQKAYSYMIGKIFEETLIDTFTGDKLDYLNFDQTIKSFLYSCLQEDVEKRDPLQNLLNHKCFHDCFDLYINIYDDNINSYKNDKEKAVRLSDLNYINNYDYNIFSVPSDHSSTSSSFSTDREITTSSRYSTSSS